MLQLRVNNQHLNKRPDVLNNSKNALGDSGALNAPQYTLSDASAAIAAAAAAALVNEKQAPALLPQAKLRDGWCSQLSRQLMYLMAWSRYPDKDVQRFQVFFDEIIRPALCDARVEASTSSGAKWLWPSFMTDSNDPVEVGMAWKGGSGPQVRFAIEAIGKQEISSSGTNLSASHELANALASVGLISRQVYIDLQQTFALNAKKHSQVFFGFDLNRGGTIDVKLYFVLDDQHRSLDRLAESLRGLDVRHGTSFEKSCQSFAKNIDGLPETERGHGVIVAFDISGDLDQSRCKLYWRFPTFDIDTVAERATYQGGMAERAAFRNLLTDCWNKVLDRSNDDASNDLKDIIDRKTGGTLVYFDLCDGVRSASKAKVYVPMRHLFQGSTSVLAKRVENFLIERSPAVERGLADAIYKSSLTGVAGSTSTSTSETQTSTTAGPEEWMTYLCTEVDKTGRAGFCVYFRSCISSSS